MTVDASNWRNCIFLERNGYLEKLETESNSEAEITEPVEQEIEQSEVITEAEIKADVEASEIKVETEIENSTPVPPTPKKPKK
jgi:hypothetical protein